MIDNTASIETGSLSPQTKASAAHEVLVANISEAKTEVAADKVVAQTSETAQVKHNEQDERTDLAPEELEKVVENLNAFVQLSKRDVSFAVDKTSGRDVISVFEADTQELIRQIPSEEALALLKRMDKAIGLLFSEKV
ncbi:MAG: flagellar protein FlaG [Alteromonadaceae bacterium]|nr:flagellar protein FlaG [Alteromonadaceae bacterium]